MLVIPAYRAKRLAFGKSVRGCYDFVGIADKNTEKIFLESGEKQVVKWTAEGAVKCDFTKYSATLQADVICRGYVGILMSAQVML